MRRWQWWPALLALGAACGSGGGARDDGGAPDALPPARAYAPSSWILGPIYGTGCPAFGDCVSPDAAGPWDPSNPSPQHLAEVRTQLAKLAELDIPITAYHFDGPAWSTVDTCSWNLGAELVAELRARGLLALLHVWGGCRANEYGLRDGVPCGCVAQSDWDRVHAQLGDVLGGFYSDDGFSNDAWVDSAMRWVHSALPEHGELVMKAYTIPLLQTDVALGRLGHTAFVNDLPSDFAGLRTGIRRMLSKASLLSAPFNELTAYDGNPAPDEETMFRRIHFGAMQMVMDHSPFTSANPWDYSPALLQAYRSYAWLHAELVPYLYSYDYAMYETNAPAFRQAQFTTDDGVAFSASTLLGDEIFVAYVGEAGVTSVGLDLPPGEWIDYWEPTRVLTGPAHVSYAVPLGHEPILIRNGSLIPLEVARDVTGHGTAESAGSLTVWVHPAGDASFRYRDEQGSSWVMLRSSLRAGVLRLSASPWPSRPVLFRVERWATDPGMVTLDGGDVVIGGASGGSPLPRAAGEAAVNGATGSTWTYDASAARVIVKVVGVPARAP